MSAKIFNDWIDRGEKAVQGPIINGRRINPNGIPDSGVYGADIIKGMSTPPGRQPVLLDGLKITRIDEGRRYTKAQVINSKTGEGLKVSHFPERTKGIDESPLFTGRRSPLSRQIIKEQVYDIASNLFKQGVDFDEDDANWVVIPDYKLPPNWHHLARLTPLLIMFPTQYPTIPPIGCYIRATIPQSPDGRLYQNAYHLASKAPLSENWKWYCVSVDEGKWMPTPVRKPNDWKHGDSIWTYVTLIGEAFANPI